jgi:23S rRNA pseudouridine1911/1915/1917 synthase
MIPDCLDILYEENGCLALNKPSGLTTQAPFPLDSLEARVKDYLRARDGKLTGRVYLGIPHRLDRVCSGAIVFADNPKAARKLARQFERRQVRKIYWACVQGQVEPATGVWTDFVRKIPEEARAEVVPADHPEAREAVLQYKARQTRPWGTWLEIELETGRMHQIRLQAAVRGHPILGDALYGSTASFGPPSDDWRLRGAALHARSLTFCAPLTNAAVTIIAPVPAPWLAMGVDGIE